MRLLTFFILVGVFCHVTRAQSGQCHRRTMHACVGRDVFRECFTDGTGQMIARLPDHSCNILTGFNNYVCYGAAKSREEICGPPPAPCKTPGIFSIPGRCQNYYTCYIERGAMQQTINECPPRYEFSPWFKKCVVASTHGGCCSGTGEFLKIPSDTVVGSLEISPNPALKSKVGENGTSTTSPPEAFVTTLSPEFTIIHETTTLTSTPTTLASTPTTLASTPTTPASTSTTFASTSTTTNYPVCFYPFTKLVDPESCHHFFECSMLLTPIKRQCPFRMRYDDVNQDCKYFTSCKGRPHFD